MNRRTTREDMRLTERMFVPKEVFENVPLSFKLDGNEIHGIPSSFKRTYTRERIDASIYRSVYTGVCEKCGLTITATHIEYRDFPVSEWVAEFKNNGDSDSPIVSDIKIGGRIAGDFKKFVYGNGDTCRDDGYEWFEDTLENGGKTIHPNDSTSCNGAFPYMKLVFDGFVVRAAVGWPHMWTATAERDTDGVSYSCGQLRCYMTIHPGEVMRTPRLTLMISAGDEADSRNLWRRWYLAHILPREGDGQPIPPLLCLHHWGCDGKPEHTAATEENQVLGIREYVRRGYTPDVWWIDAGWYKCDYNWPHIGTWKPDSERFPNGLAPVGEMCDKYGIRFLLWFEPERVVPGTELYDEHYEWLLAPENPADNHLLDLGNREACDWLIDRADSIIKEGHIRIYRQDFNFDPKGIWERAETEDRIGAVENLHVQGYLRYWDALIERNPGLWIDSCASGGRRNDLETMRRAVPLHYTDVGYGNIPVKQKQFYEMHEWIPYFRSHNMTWDAELCGNGTVYKANDEFSFMNAIVPSVTSMIWYNGTDEEFETGIRMRKIWEKAADIILSGDYYPLSVCRKDYHDWYAVQFDDTDNGRGFVQYIRNTLAEDESFTAAMLVNDGKIYTFTNAVTGETFTKSSDELKHGLTVSLPKRTGAIFFYEMK